MTKFGTRARILPVACGLALLLSCASALAVEADAAGERSARISTLLSSANQALRENRLTVPSGNNAVMYAQRVLDLSPEHPAAQEILRAVVARYGIIADMALDRAETLKAQEIAKARTYGERGKRVAQRYELSDLELRQVKERIVALESGPETAIGRGQGQQISDPERVNPVIERYLNKSATALGAGNVPDARRNYDIAMTLARDYKVPNHQLIVLGQQLMTAEQRAVRVAAQTLPLPTKAPVKGSAFRERVTPFLPPAF